MREYYIHHKQFASSEVGHMAGTDMGSSVHNLIVCRAPDGPKAIKRSQGFYIYLGFRVEGQG